MKCDIMFDMADSVFIVVGNSKCMAICDAESAAIVNQYKWSASSNGKGKIYVRTTTQPHIALHQLVAGKPPKGFELDHKNGDTFDCRKDNLRVATRSQNMANTPQSRRGVSGYRGVVPYRSKWIAQISSRGFIGIYLNAEDAALAFDCAAREVYGEFACLNFPDLNLGMPISCSRKIKTLTVGKKTLSISEWAKVTGLSYKQIWDRICYKWNDPKRIILPHDGRTTRNGRKLPPTC